jgi:hypothetical protein
MFTPLECRLRAGECKQMADHAPPEVRVILEDMARTWNRLAVKAEVRLVVVNGPNRLPPPA